MAMSKLVPFGGRHFSSVARARQKLTDDAEDIYAEFRKALKMAIAGGEYEAGIKGYQYLIGHIPADEDGVRVVDQDIDAKQIADNSNKGPTIQIGIAVTPQKQLPVQINHIDSEDQD